MALNQVVIKPPGRRDWKRMKDIRLRMLATDPAAYGGTLEEALARPTQYWKERASEDPSQMSFAAVAGKAWVGTVSCFLQEDRPGEGYIVGMWVDPQWRRLGVGRNLLEAVEKWCREKGLRGVRLHVNEDIASARLLYESLGFEYTGASNLMDRDPSINLMEMRLSLD